jgi:hypothetical protein
VTAEPSASIWEVTRLILYSPDRSPSEIAQEYGYSAAEVAELMPIFLDTARTDWSRLADDANGWAPAAGSDPGDQDAELYLRDLAGSGSIEVAGFDPPATAPETGTGQDTPAPDGEDLPPDLGELLDDLAEDGLDDGDGSDPAPTLFHAPPPAAPPPAGDPVDPPVDTAELTAQDAGLDLGDDDPFDDDTAGDLTAIDTPEPSTDVEIDDIDDPFAG